jgi:hypothetical protein
LKGVATRRGLLYWPSAGLDERHTSGKGGHHARRDPGSRRRAGAVGLLLAVAALLGTVTVAAPAQADTYRNYYSAYYGSNYWLGTANFSSGSKLHLDFWGQNPGGFWVVQQISDSPSGHDRVFLKDAPSGGRCIDDHAVSSGGYPLAISCNGGAYQIWEVFYQSNGTRVFKSWGAWTQQGRHLCLAAAAYREVIMSTCNASSSRQQWYAT